MPDPQTTSFPEIVRSCDDLGYTLSFEGYTDEMGPGNKAVAIHRCTKKRRTMMDRHYARDCISISVKLLAKVKAEAA